MAKKNKQQALVSRIQSLENRLASAPSGKPKGKKKKNVQYAKLAKRTQYEVAIFAPFSREAVGARVPDFDSRASLSYCSRDVSTITTNNIGAQMVTYVFSNPGIREWGGAIAPSVATGTWYNQSLIPWSDVTGALADVGANLSSGISGVRPVAGGFRLVPIQNAMAAQGRVYIAPLSSDSLIQFGQQSTQTVTEAMIRKLPGVRVYSISQLVGSGDVPEFHTGPLDPTAFNYEEVVLTGAASNMMAAVVFIVGATASATVFDVEFVMHWECLPSFGNMNYAGNAEPYNPSTLARVTSQLHQVDWVRLGKQAFGMATRAAKAYYGGGAKAAGQLLLTAG